MEFKGLKINIIFLVMIMVIIVFFAGQYLFKLYNIDKPVIEEIKAISGVDDIRLIDNNGKVDAMIVLGEDIDFFNVYKEIDEVLNKKLGNQKGRLLIKNENIGELDKVYYDMHYAIYEGMLTNRFVEMEKNIKEIAAQHEVTEYKLWVDSNAVFLQLEKDGYYLYHRFPYNRTISLKTEGSENNG